MFDTLLAALRTIPDRRTRPNALYKIEYVLLFTILAIASGAKGYRTIEIFIASHRCKFNELFSLNWGRSPDHTLIRGILVGLDQDALEMAFREHARSLVRTAGSVLIAFDGKELRGSADTAQGTAALRMVSAFLVDQQIILGHVDVGEKSNEIPVLQQMLGELGITGSIITADAIHCQTKTCDIAIGTKNDAVVQVKANQRKLSHKTEEICATGPSLDRHVENDHAHGRYETRETDVFAIGTALDNSRWGRHGLQTVIRVVRTTWTVDPKTGFPKDRRGCTSFYISTMAPSSAETAAGWIRQHWAIENRNHRVRDGALAEDASRIRTCAGVMARMRSFAMNLLRAKGVSNIAEALYRNAVCLCALLSLAF